MEKIDAIALKDNIQAELLKELREKGRLPTVAEAITDPKTVQWLWDVDAQTLRKG